MKVKVLEKEKVVLEQQTMKEIEFDYPTKSKFYKMVDDSNFFGRGLILFAITLKHSNSFLLFEITKNRQNYTDFIPTKDCKQEYWLTSDSDDTKLRRTALKLMIGDLGNFEEINEIEFLGRRNELLDTVLFDKI